MTIGNMFYQGVVRPSATNMEAKDTSVQAVAKLGLNTKKEEEEKESEPELIWPEQLSRPNLH